MEDGVRRPEGKGKPSLLITFIKGRVEWLDDLLASLPKHRLHASKELTFVEEGGDELTLHFADGTTHAADAVVGCDGYRSKVREIILGHDHPAVAPILSEFWDCRGSLPTETGEIFTRLCIVRSSPVAYFCISKFIQDYRS